MVRTVVINKKAFNIPMALTWARIAFIPLIVGVFYLPDTLIGPQLKNMLASVMFIIAAITDALDGYIARRYNMMTNKGAFLDTVADKLVVCSAVVVLLAFDRIDMIVALIIVGREIAITALREWMAKIGAAAAVKVNWYGKIKAIAQMTAIPMLLWYDTFLGLDMYFLGTVFIYVAAVLTFYSMCVYMLAAWPHIEAKDNE
ncbi:MAG: CDP-diacylglycerol--glycerol-3-phosphate 3-phosphatidyltransferase [Duodenibacillus sp.]|nr:CDP-diacylglycerol--glycerol-3-phosphate 3-phosphatidyltransferase [Duodenibacillus sp.]